MNSSFGSSYSSAYDNLYEDKDYDAECDLIERSFQTYSDGSTEQIIDLGCGTGNHAFRLAERGYHVTGMDSSEDMLVKARKKLRNGSNLEFTNGDLRSFRLGRLYDAALMMFAVLGYQTQNTDVLSALRSARAHLRLGGLFVFDVWYGPAVLHQRPSERLKVVPTPQGKLLRASSGEMDTLKQLCIVHYRLWLIENSRVVSEIEEQHRMRYFFPLELDLFLQTTGFKLQRLGAFPVFEQEPDEATWNVMGVARAV